MKIGVGTLLLKLFEFFESKSDTDYKPKFSPIWKKMKRHHKLPSSSPVLIFNGILTNTNVT